MEINETPVNHEHATVSLKVLLLIFAVVLVGALSYLVWTQNTAPDTTDYSATKTTTKTDDTTESTATTKGTTTTKNTTPPTPNLCKAEKSYTLPTEKLTICYDEVLKSGDGNNDHWVVVSQGTSENPKVRLEMSHTGYCGIGRWGNCGARGILQVEAVKTSEAWSYNDYKVRSSFDFNGKTVYAVERASSDLRLSACDGSKICPIAAKNMPGMFLDIQYRAAGGLNGPVMSMYYSSPSNISCANLKTYTMPTEKITASYPGCWRLIVSSYQTSSSSPYSFSLSRMSGSREDGSWFVVGVDVTQIPKLLQSSSVLDDFVLNGNKVYLMVPGTGASGGNLLSSCDGPTICRIPAKNTTGGYSEYSLQVEGYMLRSQMGSIGATTGIGSDEISKQAIAIIKSLHY